MKKILISSFILSSFFLANAKELTLEKVEKIAQELTHEFNSKLKKQLKKAKKANKTKGMTDYCINDSMKLIEELNKKNCPSKACIKRISLNNRNDKSKALEDEVKILQAFDLLQESDTYLPNQIVQIVDDNTYKVYSPIQMKSRDCKKCHGLEKKVDKESKKRFSEIYKNDRGYGYKSGEVRGAVVITVSE